VWEEVLMSSNYLTLREAADYLGLKYQTMRLYVSTGRIPHVKPGTLRYVHKRDLEAYKHRNEPKGGSI
jgi:excisionase family DNA binding protein